MLWKVVRLSANPQELENVLNKYSNEGWEIFNVFPAFVVVLKRKKPVS